MPLDIEHGLHQFLRGRVAHRAQHLDAVVQIAGHQIRRADVVLGRAGVVEDVHARVLQIPIDNADRLDPLRDALHARLQGTHTAHDQANLHAGVAGFIELHHQLAVDQIVALERHRRTQAAARVVDLALDPAQQPRARAVRRHQQVLVLVAAVGVLQKIEHVLHFTPELLIVGQQREVGVQTRRFLVEVPGADMAVIALLPVLTALDEQQLAVHLEPGDAELHLDAALGQPMRPGDVGLFIEARGQFHHRQHALAVVHRIEQSIDHPRVRRDAVQANLDALYLRVHGRRLEQIDDVAEGVVGVAQQHIALAQRGQNIVGGVHRGQRDRRQRFEFQVLGAHRRKGHKILGVVVAPAGNQAVVLAQRELAGQKFQQPLGHLRVVHEAHRIGLLALLQAAGHLLDQTFHNAHVEFQLGVARKLETESTRRVDGQHAAKHLRQTGPYHVIQRDKKAPRPALVTGNLHKAPETLGGHFHHRDAVLFARLDIDCQIQRLVVEHGNGRAVAKQNRLQFRQQGGGEVRLYKGRLSRVQLALVNHVDAPRLQGAHDRLFDPLEVVL